MLSDPNRGPALELAITKILHSKHAGSIQIVGMSATMGGTLSASSAHDSEVIILILHFDLLFNYSRQHLSSAEFPGWVCRP